MQEFPAGEAWETFHELFAGHVLSPSWRSTVIPRPTPVTSRSGGPRRACEDNSPRVGRLAELDFTWEVNPQRVGRESVSATHEAHEPFDQIISVHAAWDVGGGGTCTEMI